MAVSVIVSNFNGARFLPRLLDSLVAQRNVETQIIIVDRLSSDRSREILSATVGIMVVSEPPESGLAAGYVVGARHAKHEHLFFCNEDMWFDSDCLATLESLISIKERVAVADPWQWTYDGATLIHQAMGYSRGWNRGSPDPRWIGFPKPAKKGDVIPVPCAGAMMIHGLAYADVGGWDSSFFLDFEDLDLAIRLWQRGWTCVTAPSAKVYHAVGASNVQHLRDGVTVGEKRYICAASNRVTIAFKYFRGPAVAACIFGLAEHLVKNVLKLRFRQAWWDIRAFASGLRRFVKITKAGAASRSPPGEGIFADPRFSTNSNI